MGVRIKREVVFFVGVRHPCSTNQVYQATFHQNVKLYLGFKTTGNASLTSRNDTVNRMTTPGNNLAHTLFKQVNFRANGTFLTGQEDMYHLKAYIQTVLNYDRDDGETILQPTGWRDEIESPVTIGKQNLPLEPSKIPVTTSTFNSMELSIILIAR